MQWCVQQSGPSRYSRTVCSQVPLVDTVGLPLLDPLPVFVPLAALARVWYPHCQLSPSSRLEDYECEHVCVGVSTCLGVSVCVGECVSGVSMCLGVSMCRCECVSRCMSKCLGVNVSVCQGENVCLSVSVSMCLVE